MVSVETKNLYFDDQYPEPRRCHSMCKDKNGNVYIFGGETAKEYENDLWRINSYILYLYILI